MDALLTSLLDRFAQAEACWYSSVRSDGRTHLAPIWHIWHQDAIYVVTQTNAVRAQNLRHNRSVSLALPDPMNVLVIEGAAEFAPDAEPTIRPLFQAKYNWDIGNDVDYGCIIRVTPTKVMAWGNHGEGRWRYSPETATWL